MSSSFWNIHPDPASPPYKWSYLARKWKDTRYATTAHTVLYCHRMRQVIWHLFQPTTDLSLVLFVVNTPGLASQRRWTRKQDSCLQRVPWPLSRAYYHVLDVSLGLESHSYPAEPPNSPVSAIGEEADYEKKLIMGLMWLVDKIKEAKKS